MLWTCLLSLAIPVYAEVSLSTATEVPSPPTEAVAISSPAEPGPDALPATFYFKDGTKLEGRWEMQGLVLRLPQGPLHTSADLLQRIEFSTGMETVPLTLPLAPVATPPVQVATTPAPGVTPELPQPLVESLFAQAYKAGGVFGGAARRPSHALGLNIGFSVRSASKRWEGRLDGGTYTHEWISATYGVNYSETHTQWANIRYIRISGGRFIRLGYFDSLRSLIGSIPGELRLGGGFGLYELTSREHHAYYFNYNTISTYEPNRTWHELVPHLDAAFIVRLHRRVELQLSSEFVASKTHVAGYRYGGFAGLLQLAIR